jgi:hypothetical protein
MVGLHGHEQTEKLGLPGWVANLVHASSIRADHLVWVRHDQRIEHGERERIRTSCLEFYRPIKGRHWQSYIDSSHLGD